MIKISDVMVRAAERIATGKEDFCCIAIHEVAASLFDDYVGKPWADYMDDAKLSSECYRFLRVCESYFKQWRPKNKTDDDPWFGPYWCRKNRTRRYYTLMDAARIARQEGK